MRANPFNDSWFPARFSINGPAETAALPRVRVLFGSNDLPNALLIAVAGIVGLIAFPILQLGWVMIR
jgi:hypothetical protein